MNVELSASVEVDAAARDEFMSAPLFHLNPFVNSEARQNVAFGPFIREQVATPGFHPVGQGVVDLVDQGGSYLDVRNELKLRGGVGGSEAGQVALWLTQAKVGSYVVMRHEYKNCPFLPRRLKDDEGKYIGEVYVLGRVTKVVEPNSGEERSITASLRFPGDYEYFAHTFCRVRFDRMILKSTLQRSTTRYISKICQRTVCKICDGSAWPELKTDSTTVRADLWDNANIQISGDDFDDVFSESFYRSNVVIP